jgi:hypothetical protein
VGSVLSVVSFQFYESINTWLAIGNDDRKLTMPTILVILGWRLFFYANEGNESIHVHCRKGEMECKYWLDRELFDIEEAFSFHMAEKDKRQIRKIIYEHFEYIESQRNDFQRRRQQ